MTDSVGQCVHLLAENVESKQKLQQHLDFWGVW